MALTVDYRMFHLDSFAVRPLVPSIMFANLMGSRTLSVRPFAGLPGRLMSLDQVPCCLRGSVLCNIVCHVCKGGRALFSIHLFRTNLWRNRSLQSILHHQSANGLGKTGQIHTSRSRSFVAKWRFRYVPPHVPRQLV